MAMWRSPDTGRWVAREYNGRAFLDSEDFTHDVSLQIMGDFASIEDKMAYADELAGWMNERLMDDSDDKVKPKCPCSTCKNEHDRNHP